MSQSNLRNHNDGRLSTLETQLEVIEESIMDISASGNISRVEASLIALMSSQYRVIKDLVKVVADINISAV